MSASGPGSAIERRNAPIRWSAPRSSRISSTTARYSRSSARICSPLGSLVLVRLDLDAQVAAGAGAGGPDRRPVQALDGDRLGAAGQLHALGHGRDRADAGELVFVARHQDDPLLVAEVEGERDAHTREHDRVVQWHE